MVLVYQEPLRVKYYAKWHSFPALFRVGNLLSVIAVALVTTYVTGSMWVKTRVSYEQPDVVFDSKLMMVFESSFVSTDLSVTQEDYNFDGKVDTVRIKLRSSVGAAIRGVKILAQFDYKLRERVHMNMKTLAYVAHSGGVPGSALHADGSLSLRQREPLPDDSTRREYLEDLLRDSEPDGMLQASTELGVSSILEDYFFRNETTVLSENYASWEAGLQAKHDRDPEVRLDPVFGLLRRLLLAPVVLGVVRLPLQGPRHQDEDRHEVQAQVLLSAPQLVFSLGPLAWPSPAV